MQATSAHRRVLFAVLAIAGLLVLAAPIAYTLYAGFTPYQALIRTFPGPAVGAATSFLAALTDIAAVVTIG
ncbi:MAG: hypothetical protein Q4G35_13770, partial [Propionibacteriaceae bacterium]|nr:hypothetical protein [Propionibacteriaceae bacterium]